MRQTIRAQIAETIAADRSEILAFTQKLVAIATENPPGTNYKLCVEAIIKKLSEIGLDYEIIEVPHPESEKLPRYCFLSSYGTGEKTLYFHGHYDVVPASSEDQFQP